MVINRPKGSKPKTALNVTVAGTVFFFSQVPFDKIDNFSLPFRQPLHMVTNLTGLAFSRNSDTRNRILVVESDSAAREQLDNILQEIVEEGGELIFTQKREDALEILKKQRPVVLLLDSRLRGNHAAWNLEDVHVIILLERGDTATAGEDHLFKPFRANQVIEKCREHLSQDLCPPSLPCKPIHPFGHIPHKNRGNNHVRKKMPPLNDTGNH